MISEETRKKLSESKIGENNPMYGTISPTRKIFVSKEELEDFYINKGHNIRWIAKKYGVHYRTIQNWLRTYDIRLTKEEHMRRSFGEKHWNYKGYKNTVRGYTYIYKPDHPYCNRDNYVMEHRLVVEGYIGRYLQKNEQVHHLDHNKKNNVIENLVLFNSAKEHTEFHKHMELVAIYLLGIAKQKPEPIEYKNKVLFKGQWTNCVNILN